MMGNTGTACESHAISYRLTDPMDSLDEKKHKKLGGGNSIIFIFTPILGEDEPNLTSIFFKGVGWNHQLENYTPEIEHRYQKKMVSNMFLL